MDWWWDRFDSVIREWVREDPTSMTTWDTAVPINDYTTLQEMAKRGQIAQDASERTAVWEALIYQRGHINAFRSVLREPLKGIAADNAERTIGIIDLGCGAGTAGFAFGETFNARTTFHYVGQDHNKPSRQLCRAMLENGISPQGGTVKVVKDLTTAFDHAIGEWPKVDRIFVASSYLLCQRSMTEEAVLSIAAEIERLVSARGSVRLVIGDAPLSWSLAPLLVSTLRVADEVRIEKRWSDTSSYSMQFPTMTGRAWRGQRSSTVEGHYLVLNRA